MRLGRALGVLLTCTLVLGLSVTQIGTVSATRPMETTFTLTIVPEEIDVELEVLPSGAMKHTLNRIVHMVDGDWVGIWEHSGFARLSPTNTFFAIGFGTFTGTILGMEGTAEVKILTHGTWDFPAGPFELTVEKVTILGGTGELANIHGHGSTDVETGIIHAWLHFNP